jgi:hypothetical protein
MVLCLLSKSVKIKTCKTIIFPTFLNASEAWCVRTSEEQSLKVPENDALTVFGPNIRGFESRNEELPNVYSSPIEQDD